MTKTANIHGTDGCSLTPVLPDAAEVRRQRRLAREAEAIRIVRSINNPCPIPLDPDWRRPTPEEQEAAYIDGMDDNPEHTVYFLYCAGYVKIGYTSKCFIGRTDTLANGTPIHTVVLLGIPGGKRTEYLLHKKFAEFRGGGEWFRFDQSIRDFIAENGTEHTARAVHQAEFNHRGWVEREAVALGLLPFPPRSYGGCQ